MSWDNNPWEPSEDGVILRNKFRVTDKAELDSLEFSFVRANMKQALAMLQLEKEITLQSWQRCHAILFSDLYPWAGQIRHLEARRRHAPFNYKNDIESSTNDMLSRAKDSSFFSDHLGEVYCVLAFNHPFIDGNGRTLNAVFTELARRSDFGIAWDKVNKETYLSALTQGVMFMMYNPLDGFLNDLKVMLDHYDPETSLTTAHTAK
ncbi:Fic family protein [Rhizobium sp. MHM7A]|uniref:Fic family protein n=1 Tax=Rhizobium sp. MHM7A TaxID=2583233 RepID=UPI001487492E|nr:Fic family protein [Rhizobium sp. MHM7A]